MEKKILNRKLLFSSILWASIYIGCLLILRKTDPSRTLAIILSFLPTLTFGLFIYNFTKLVGAMDEVERRIQLEAVVWAFSLGLLLLMTLGLLDIVVTLKKEDWGYTHIIPFFFGFYCVGILISRRKYN